MDVRRRPISLRRLVLMLCLLLGLTQAQDFIVGQNQKVCRGTTTGLVGQGDEEFRYRLYRSMYENCTHVKDNLEIVFLEKHNANFDMSFLESIEEVLGYVLLVGNVMDYIPLTNLRIIRGKNLYSPEPDRPGEYSLFVALNYLKGSSVYGLKELRFTSLTEILNGKVYFNNNNMLCYENTIDWSDINPREKPAVEFHFNSTEVKRQCGECHPDCYQNTTDRRHCWGEGPHLCQKLTEGDVCHKSCEGRCYGKLPNQCCHPECAGGCVGPKKTDCFACKNFQNEGECVSFCPRPRIYDSKKLMFVINPNAKYTFGSLCVDDCPKFLVKDEGACVKECSVMKYINAEQTCTTCEGPCPRTCNGTYAPNFIDASNINDFEDCTIIKGPIRILISTFNGDPHKNVAPLHPSNLTALSKVQTITEFLMVQSQHPELEDLSFLSSLKTIQGMETSQGYSLSILGTRLKSLRLVSLEAITNGNVLIAGNVDMCFSDTVGWRDMFVSDKQRIVVHSSKPKAKCEEEGNVCHSQCKDGLCWGPGPEMCRECANVVYKSFSNSTCLNTCQDLPMLYHVGDNVCKECHPECNNTCAGPKNTDCDSCAHVIMLGENGTFGCLETCPEDRYPDEQNVCRLCHPNCEGGCTGPSDVVEEGGCNSCEVGIIPFRDKSITRCLPRGTDSCDSDFHLVTLSSQIKDPLAGKRVCELCDPLCLTCNGPGVRYCEKCRFFRYDSVCTKDCPQFAFGDNVTKTCLMCDGECRGGCHGPDSTDCDACTNFKIYLDEERTVFNCTEKCPDHLDYIVEDEDSDDLIVCADLNHPAAVAQREKNADNYRRKLALIIGPAVGGTLLLAGLLVLFGYFWHKRAKSNEKTAALTARMAGFDETEPLTPTTAKPDLAQLRLIKESELRRGGIIGSGAFGTVYKGFWIPEGENVKIPVAIKVLQEGAPNQNKELLEEARVMASVEHPCCIRILAVCMTAQMMLITQLMPLGCLLDYVRKNKDHIGSKVLLNWCTQIARGMTYLEDRGIVHRDLAARNVLVQTPNQVKITDFGLAKLLDFNEEEYHAAGGKMPIKWLALECIQHRIFTHKSDVWSYGVTVWELFTYGQKPYDTIRARDVPDLLEKGERLPQPHICTIDVYMIMIKCWMLDAESRPSFKELAEEFAKMARDPGRYLVIQGDVLKKMPEETLLAADMAMDIDPSQGPQPLQGDKLMRLPSHSYDKQDLIRSLSVAGDGDEEVVEADDYLQPHVSLHDNNNSPNAKMPLLPEGASNVDMLGKLPGGKEGLGGASRGARREKRYAHLDAAAEAKQQRQLVPRGRQDSVTRYSSDPIRFRPSDELGGDEFGNPVYQSYPWQPSSAGLDPGPVRLPVDEDNYLQPRTSKPLPAYMDLDDKVYYQNEKQLAAAMAGGDVEEDGLPTIHPMSPAVANPEYFDSEPDPPTWTRPTLNGGPHSPPPPLQSSASSSSSSHPPSYYNDLSHLAVHPRELEPLVEDVTRSESTV